MSPMDDQVVEGRTIGPHMALIDLCAAFRDDYFPRFCDVIIAARPLFRIIPLYSQGIRRYGLYRVLEFRASKR